MTDSVSYAALEAALAAAGKPFQAAEVHGILSGLLCVDADVPVERAVAAVTEAFSAVPEEPVPLISSLLSQTRLAFEDTQLTFDLLLPEDEVPLSQRAQSLAYWCQGYLYGLGTGGKRKWSGQAEEILRDFQAICQLDPEAEGEENEQAFAELVEYVRIGAQLLFTESALARKKEKTGGR